MKKLILLLSIITISCATNSRKNSSCKETIIHECYRNGDTIKSTQVKIIRHAKNNM